MGKGSSSPAGKLAVEVAICALKTVTAYELELRFAISDRGFSGRCRIKSSSGPHFKRTPAHGL